MSSGGCSRASIDRRGPRPAWRVAWAWASTSPGDWSKPTAAESGWKARPASARRSTSDFRSAPVTRSPRMSRRTLIDLLRGLVASALLAACAWPAPGTPVDRRSPDAAPAARRAEAQPTAPRPGAETTRDPTPTAPRALRPVPRDRTFISVGVGGEAPGRFTDVELQNPFLPGITRSGYQIAMEPLFYYNAYHTATTCGPPDA